MDDSRKDNSPWSQAEINPALDLTVWLFGGEGDGSMFLML